MQIRDPVCKNFGSGIKMPDPKNNYLPFLFPVGVIVPSWVVAFIAPTGWGISPIHIVHVWRREVFRTQPWERLFGYKLYYTVLRIPIHRIHMLLDLPDPGSISLRYRYGSETCNKNLYSFEKLMSIILQKVKSRKNNNPDHISQKPFLWVINSLMQIRL